MEIYYENVDDLFLEGEIWKDIEEYNGDYQVSNLGRIKSFKKYHGTYVRILKQINNGAGHLRVKLCKNGKEKNKQIHDLMFESFNNYKLKKGEVIHHIDQNPSNNLLDNFQKMTLSEHTSLHMYGKKHSEETKQLIREKKLGKHHSEETKQLMREIMSGENNPMYGKTGKNHQFYGKNHSGKTKQLIRENHADVSGENHPQVKITEQDVYDIRRSLELKLYTPKQLSWMFDISISQISNIKNGRKWKNI